MKWLFQIDLKEFILLDHKFLEHEITKIQYPQFGSHLIISILQFLITLVEFVIGLFNLPRRYSFPW